MRIGCANGFQKVKICVVAGVMDVMSHPRLGQIYEYARELIKITRATVHCAPAARSCAYLGELQEDGTVLTLFSTQLPRPQSESETRAPGEPKPDLGMRFDVAPVEGAGGARAGRARQRIAFPKSGGQ